MIGTSAIDRNKLILEFSLMDVYMRIACILSRLYVSRPFPDLPEFFALQILSLLLKCVCIKVDK
jgi:hypothetical protein